MKKKSKILKLILFSLVIIIFVGITIYLFPVIKELSTVEGQLAFKEKVSESGFIGLLSLFLLQLAQIFLIIIPGEPIEILAGMCYGGIGGLVFITISAFLITSLILFLVRKFGRKFVYEFCDKKRIEKIENNKLFKDTKKIELIMIILFFIPGTPKDLLVYIAGLLPIDPVRFVIISTFARLPSVISSTFAGENLALGDWKFSIIVYGITFAIVGVIIFVINKFDKSKLTKEVVNSIVIDNVKNK